MRVQYGILDDTDYVRLRKRIAALVASGWDTDGPLEESGEYYIQAMIKRVKEKDDNIKS